MWDPPIEAYLREMAESEVQKALLLGLKAGSSLGIEVPNAYLAQAAQAHPDRLAWACCVVPTVDGAADEVHRCVTELGAVGEMGPAYAG